MATETTEPTEPEDTTTTEPPAADEAAPETEGEPPEESAEETEGEPAAADATEPEEGSETDEDEAAAAAQAKRNAKVRAGKKSGESRAKAAQRRAELAKDNDVQRLLKDAEAKGAKRAKDAAEETAKRETMTEVERVNAEKDDLKRELEEARTQVGQAARERDYSEAVATSDLTIQPKAKAQVRSLVAEAMEADNNLDVHDALQVVLDEHHYMVVPTEAPSALAAPPKVTTTPRRTKTTETPTLPGSGKKVDVKDMTRQQFREHKAREHGIH